MGYYPDPDKEVDDLNEVINQLTSERDSLRKRVEEMEVLATAMREININWQSGDPDDYTMEFIGEQIKKLQEAGILEVRDFDSEIDALTTQPAPHEGEESTRIPDPEEG